METGSIEIFIKALDKFQGLPIPENIIDYIYVLGHISKEDYKTYYMDSTRMHKPKLCLNTAGFLEDLYGRVAREEIVENKNVLLYEAKIMKELML